MDDHLGCQRGDRAVKDAANERNGRRAKTVTTEIGPARGFPVTGTAVSHRWS
jgi:transposase-like protein